MGDPHLLEARQLHASSPCCKTIPPKLLAFTDVFIQTRPADQLFEGITLVGQNHEQMYTASFIRGPEIPDTFIVDNTSETEEATSKMEVDEPPALLQKE